MGLASSKINHVSAKAAHDKAVAHEFNQAMLEINRLSKGGEFTASVYVKCNDTVAKLIEAGYECERISTKTVSISWSNMNWKGSQKCDLK